MLIFIILGTFVSCKNKTEKLNIEKTPIVDFLTENALYYLCGLEQYKKSGSDFFPENLQKLLTYSFRIDGEQLYLLEMLNPRYKGIIDSSNFYNQLDSGFWVDGLVFRLNESLMALTLEELENNSIPALDEDTEAEKIERVIEEAEKIEKRLTSLTNQLKILEFDTEVFIPGNNTESKITVEKNEKEVKRIYYDDIYRVTKKEFWSISNLINSKIIKTELYEYKENSMKVNKKTEQSENQKFVNLYNENGLLSRREKYDIYENKEYLVSVNTWKYNSNKNVIEEQSVTNKYGKNYVKITSKNTIRSEFVYNNGEEIPPDLAYYENNVLKMKNTYTSTKGKYTSKVYLGDGFTVTTFYEDNLRKKDVYAVNGIERRVENYE